MFYCKRCDRDFPDDTEECPICHTVNWRFYRKKTAPIRRLIIFSDVLVLATFLINVFLLVTCSHYCLIYDYGIFAAHAYYWDLFPALLPAEIVFTLLLTALPLVSVIGRKRMHQRRLVGVKIMIGVYSGFLLWNIAFPLCTFMITSVISPMLTFTVILTAIFFALALTASILLWNYDWIYT